MKTGFKRGIMVYLLFLLLFLISVQFVSAAPSWDGSPWESIYNSTENATSPYHYDFSKNVTADDSDKPLKYKYGQDSNISSTLYGAKSPSFFNWISLDTSSGILSINSTRDNRTGMFNITVDVYDKDDDNSAGARTFKYIINATNEEPSFTKINSSYTLKYGKEFEADLSGTDQEEHYPLDFDISWGDCDLFAEWSDRNNCSLSSTGFNLTNVSNVSAMMNYTPDLDDVGTYWANITVRDNGGEDSCPHEYCDNESYEQNKTETRSVKFNITSSLDVNASDCNNSSLKEGEDLVCNISIRTKGNESTLNISSTASLNPSDSEDSDFDSSWFFGETRKNSSNYTKELNINISNLNDSLVGNWSIDLSVDDLDSSESEDLTIDLFVNNTEDNVIMDNIPDKESLYKDKTFYFNATDEDLLVPDKSVKDESFTSSSNVTDEWVSVTKENIEGDEIKSRVFVDHDQIVNDTGINYSEGENYTFDVNINVTDESENVDNDSFSVEIMTENAPVWNITNKSYSIQENSSAELINLSKYASDEDENDTITYYYKTSTTFPSFDLNSSTGIINFTPDDEDGTPDDEDVGFHNVSVIASDSKLNTTDYMTFNVSNINDDPVIVKIINSSNDKIQDLSNVTVSEDDQVKFRILTEDDDYYHNEHLTLDSTILNSSGSNVDLFNFEGNEPASPNIRYFETTFTPDKPDVGEYTVTSTVKDESGANDSMIFNLTVNPTEHDPVMDDLDDQYSAVNRSLYYDIDATDEEEINESVGNLTFSHEVISGRDILNGTLNSSTGEINITFNSTQGGKHDFNVTVIDSAGNTDTKEISFKVYDKPEVNEPSQDHVFNLSEREKMNFTFKVNHSVGDNLTYKFYMDNVTSNFFCANESNSSTCDHKFLYDNLTLRKNINYYGNNTEIKWEYYPDYRTETYGNYKNLTMVAYPQNPHLSNLSDLNKTINWKVNITHTNEELELVNNFTKDYEHTWESPVAIDLREHFHDIDYLDDYYDQPINFTVHSFATYNESENNETNISSKIEAEYNHFEEYNSGDGWNLSLKPSVEEEFSETLRISGCEGEVSKKEGSSINETSDMICTGNQTISDNFTVTFTEAEKETEEAPSSGGGGGGSSSSTTEKEIINNTEKVTQKISLDIKSPDRITVNESGSVKIPVSLANEGDKEFLNVGLSSVVKKDKDLIDKKAKFSKKQFAQIVMGERKDLSMFFNITSVKPALYKIKIMSDAEQPIYSNSETLFIDYKPTKALNILDKISLAEGVVNENPECLDLSDMVEDARDEFNKSNLDSALEKARSALEACNEATKEDSDSLEKMSNDRNSLVYIMGIGFIAAITVGLLFNFYRSSKFKRSRK